MMSTHRSGRDSLERIRDGLRVELYRSWDAPGVTSARGTQPSLASFSSPESFLEVLDSDRGPGARARADLVDALLVEYQANPTPFWAAAVVLAHYPLLLCLFDRLQGDPEEAENLAQLIVTSFVDVAATLSLDRTYPRTSLHLKQRTLRRIAQQLRAESRERAGRKRLQQATSIEEQTIDPRGAFLPGDFPPAVMEGLVRLASLARDKSDHCSCALILRTLAGDESLRDVVRSAFPGRGRAERARVYRRLRYLRSQLLDRLRRCITEGRDPSALLLENEGRSGDSSSVIDEVGARSTGSPERMPPRCPERRREHEPSRTQWRARQVVPLDVEGLGGTAASERQRDAENENTSGTPELPRSAVMVRSAAATRVLQNARRRCSRGGVPVAVSEDPGQPPMVCMYLRDLRDLLSGRGSSAEG